MTYPDSKKIQQYNANIAYHTAPLLEKLGIAIDYNLNVLTTDDDVNHMIDAMAAIYKRNVESNLYYTPEQKESLQHQCDVNAEAWKQLNNRITNNTPIRL
ncbi:MAG: hypothetical protein IJ776_00890 [Paludibacteraceae bacterium]|nr:hypothetical protein [Paludibacteraceae bacterium]